MPNYPYLDRSSTLRYIFYPGAIPPPVLRMPLNWPCLGRSRTFRFDAALPHHPQGPGSSSSTGNGEIAADYDDIAPFYTKRPKHRRCRLQRIRNEQRSPYIDRPCPRCPNSFPGDDGRTGKKGASESTVDHGEIPRKHLRNGGGSSASRHPWGLIIESGFTSVVRIIRHLGLPAEDKALKTSTKNVWKG